jgi:hypothetical protein
MKSQNQPEKDTELLNTPESEAATNAGEPSEVDRILTDEELIKVAGGVGHGGWIEIQSASFR